MVRDRRVREFLLHHVDESLLKFPPCIPYLLVTYLVDALEALLVIMMCLELRAEHLGVDSLPFLGSPSRIMHTVGYIADIELLRQISRIHIGENFLADLAV